MNEKAEELKKRAHTFFVRVIALCNELPARPAEQSIARQLVASAGSTDSNYRAACRARSRREFIAKLGVAIEEADECKGWLEALQAAKLADQDQLAILIQEADELTRIFVKSRKTAEANLEQEKQEEVRRRALRQRRRST